jgi:hypothetical protein
LGACYKPAVRRALLIGVSALAVGLAAAAATSSAIAPKQVSCNRSLVIILFWPRGHGAIKSVGFQADRRPHIEIYKYGRNGYPRRNFLAYAAVNGKTRFAASCKTKIGNFPSGSISSRITARRARAYSCRLPTDARIHTMPIKRGLQVDIGSPGSKVVSAKLHARSSLLDFSRASCNPGPPPK